MIAEEARQGAKPEAGSWSHLTEWRGEVVRAGIEAWNRSGVSAFKPFMADEICWQAPPELPGGGTFYGIDETMQFLTTWEQGGGIVEMQLRIVEMVPARSDILLVLDAEVVGESSGVSIPSFHWYMVLRFNYHDLLVRNLVFLNRAQAFEAAGLEVPEAAASYE